MLAHISEQFSIRTERAVWLNALFREQTGRALLQTPLLREQKFLELRPEFRLFLTVSSTLHGEKSYVRAPSSQNYIASLSSCILLWFNTRTLRIDSQRHPSPDRGFRRNAVR